MSIASLDVIKEEKLSERYRIHCLTSFINMIWTAVGNGYLIHEGSKALHDVLEHDLPNMEKVKPAKVSQTTTTTCNRCGRNLYLDKDL